MKPLVFWIGRVRIANFGFKHSTFFDRQGRAWRFGSWTVVV